MLRTFIGYDEREAAGLHVFMESLIRTSSEPVAVIPIHGKQGDGTNAFTTARFLVPYYCDFEGMALFLDGSDMLMRADISELASLYDPNYALQVVKHEYQTQHPLKYIGTEMEAANQDYPMKNWSSVMIWNCGHMSHRWMEPQTLAEMTGSFLHRLSWLHPDQVGALPAEWNVLVGEQEAEAKLAHFTLGIPGIPHYQDSMYSDEWRTMQDCSQRLPILKEQYAESYR